MTRARIVGWDDPDVAALRAAQQAEIAVLYGEWDPGWDMTGDGVLAVAMLRSDEGEPVACGALRDATELGAGTGELKRMFVVPSRRGTGLSRQVLDELEAAAAARGLTRLVLETGPLQAAAIGLYLAAGYLPTDRFAPYQDDPTSRAFAKDLAAPPPGREPGQEDVDGLVVERVDWWDPTAVALRAEMGRFLRGLYGVTGWFADGEAADTREAGRILVVLVVRDDDGPLGTLALAGEPSGRPADWGELKRMYVAPRSRGKGVARLLLRAAEDEARARGLSALTLTTGFRQYPAMRLYLSSGYRVVPAAGEGWQRQERLFWFAKTL